MQKSKNLGYPLLKLLILLIGAITRRRLATLAELATRILIFHLPPIDLSVSRRLPAFTENGAGLKFTVHYLIARSTW